MGKNDKNQHQTPKTTAAPANEAPTDAQLQDIGRLGVAAAEIPAQFAVDSTPAEPPPGLKLAQAIKDALNAERTFLAAKRKAEESQQKLTQDERALQQQKAEAEQDKRRRLAELEKQAEDWRKKLAELDAREQQLLEKAAGLAERERNAEQGFLKERRAMVAALEEELSTMRREIEGVTRQADELRSREQAEWSKRIEERSAEWRREEEERAARWRREEEERARAAAEERRRFEEELARERARDSAERGRLWAEQRAKLDEEERGIEARRAENAAEERRLRGLQSRVQADLEMLGEDRKMFDRKVELFAARRVAEVEAELAAVRGQLDDVAAERDRMWQELESRREIDRRFGGERPEQALDRLRQAERENHELKVKLGASLGEDSARRLAELEKARSAWLEERAVLRAQLVEKDALLGQKRIAAIELETLRAQKEALEVNKALLDQALNELKAEVNSYTEADQKRNPMEALLALDRDPSLQRSVRTVRPLGQGGAVNLKEFAGDLRHRIALGIKDRKLYYSPRDIRCFLGGLAMSRLMLLQGISGTGKTSLPLAFAAATDAGVEVVEVQAGWRDRQDLVGYFNAFHRHYYATNFLQALYKTRTPHFQDRLFLIVLDEVNLSRVEQFFADFLSTLEQPEEKRRLTLMNDPVQDAPSLMVDGRHLPIPPNVWFVGTANHDETTTEFADKTYDRAHVMELPRRDPTRDGFEIKPRGNRDPISYKGLMEAFSDAQRNQVKQVEMALQWLRDSDGIAPMLEKSCRIGWGNRFERDVELFVPVVVESGGTVGEALDHLLHTKVLRKLRDRHDVRVKGLEELRTALTARWKELGEEPKQLRSLELIDRELGSKRDEEVG